MKVGRLNIFSNHFRVRTSDGEEIIHRCSLLDHFSLRDCYARNFGDCGACSAEECPLAKLQAYG